MDHYSSPFVVCMPSGLSAVEPTTYYRRFMLKCREILLDSEADTQVSSMEDDIQSDDDDASALA